MDTLEAALDVAEVTALRVKSYNATLVRRINLTEDLARFQVQPDKGIPNFAPGQYVALGLGNWEPRIQPSQIETLEPSKIRKLVRRAYSISCPMLDANGGLLPCSKLNYLEFYIVLVREAATPPGLTPRLFLLEEGARLSVEKKIVGHYTMSAIQPDDDVWFFATGTGEAPHNAMATELLVNGHRGPIIMVSCVRGRSDLGYLPTHVRLEKQFPNYRYLTYTTREPENLNPNCVGFVGKQYLQTELESGGMEMAASAILSASKSHVFLCGNPEMIGLEAPGARPLSRPGMIQILEQRGFRREGEAGAGLIRFEKYW